MAQIFLSYARPDERQAEQVADALRGEGHDVWRDDQLPAHRAYADVIAERLKSADAVVVLWSSHAAASQWVRAEADIAREAGTLVQARLDPHIPPLPFNQIQCADLSQWDGDAQGSGWRKLLSSIGDLAPCVPVATKAPRPGRGRSSICILPFANMSGDPEQEYFSDGISEDITTDLAKIPALGVVARNTAFTFKGKSVNVCDVARRLDVSHILEGSVRKSGTRIRINAQLVDGASGEHVWAERFDRDLDDIFDIQDEIALAIVRALKLKLLTHDRSAVEMRGTASAEAYAFFLLARQYWLGGNEGDIRRDQRVMRICARAIEIDPRYGRAWALLAIAQSSLRYNFRQEVDDGAAAANAALSIDPSLAEAHCPMVRRLEERQAISEADALMETALVAGPESWEVHKEAARVRMRQGRHAQAAQHLEAAVALVEPDVHAWARLVTLRHALGEHDAKRSAAKNAIAQAEAVLGRDPSNGTAMSLGAIALAALGETERSREWIDRAILVDPDNLAMRYNLACALACYLDDPQEALRQLTRSLKDAGPFHLNMARTDPDLSPLSGNEAFVALTASGSRFQGQP